MRQRSELRRGLERVVTNYGRLAVTLVLALVLVPLLLRLVGKEGYGLLALLGSSTGIAQLVQEAALLSMNRELGAAYNGGDDDHFRETYNSAIVVCVGAALFTLVVFSGLALAVPLFNVSTEMVPAARIFVMAKGVQSATLVVCAPAYNMYVVKEQFALRNFWVTLERASLVVVAVSLLWAGYENDPIEAVRAYGVGVASVATLVILVSAGFAIAKDDRLRPRPALASRTGTRQVLSTGGWNAATVTAMNMHLRLDAVIMNLSFGLVGSLMFGLTMQVADLTRRATVGMTLGIDAVAARISETTSAGELQKFVAATTRLHALVALPALAVVAALAEPFLQIWVGERVGDPVTIARTAILVQIVAIGTSARAIADGWLRTLYGAGHIRAGVPLVLFGGFLNPVLAVLLLWVLPGPIKYIAPAVGFAAVIVVVHGAFVPIVWARVLAARWRRLLVPLLRPALAAALGCPVLVAARWQIQTWSVASLLVTILVFGAVYALLAVVVGLPRSDRERLLAAVRRRLP